MARYTWFCRSSLERYKRVILQFVVLQLQAPLKLTGVWDKNRILFEKAADVNQGMVTWFIKRGFRLAKSGSKSKLGIDRVTKLRVSLDLKELPFVFPMPHLIRKGPQSVR